MMPNRRSGGSRGGSGSGRRFESRGPRREGEERREDRPMFDAVCDKCKQPCKVPFKPDPNKGPVLCKECYMKEHPRR